jgi:hypothetical protein
VVGFKQGPRKSPRYVTNLTKLSVLNLWNLFPLFVFSQKRACLTMQDLVATLMIGEANEVQH